jgi:hypothetical protein
MIDVYRVGFAPRCGVAFAVGDFAT